MVSAATLLEEYKIIKVYPIRIVNLHPMSDEGESQIVKKAAKKSKFSACLDYFRHYL